MAATSGSLDPHGCPHITIWISPEGGETLAKECQALIDTGFTGFAQLPMRDAEALGLVSNAEMEVMYADGTTAPVPVVWASVRLAGQVRQGFIFLEERSAEVLVGVHFLREFRKTLIVSVSRNEVLLTDDLPQ